jgi:hypothetical protein
MAPLLPENALIDDCATKHLDGQWQNWWASASSNAFYIPDVEALHYPATRIC